MKAGAWRLQQSSQCQFAQNSLQYVHDFDGLVIAFKMKNKRKWSCQRRNRFNPIRLGNPKPAEELQISRNLFLQNTPEENSHSNSQPQNQSN
jgi:hypothetical protein